MPLVPPPRISVEYDKGGERALKTFDDPYEARRFYVAKLKAGKNPLVRTPSADTEI
jgi:hypothetical protein